MIITTDYKLVVVETLPSSFCRLEVAGKPTGFLFFILLILVRYDTCLYCHTPSTSVRHGKDGIKEKKKKKKEASFKENGVYI